MHEDKTVARIRSEIERCNRDLEALRRTLSILENGGEVRDHEINVAVSTPQTRKTPLSSPDNKGTILESIQRVLAEAGKPLTIKALYEQLSEEGETPYKETTLRTKVYTAAQAGKIKKIGAGLFTVEK